jgi:hypothetical protein
MFSVQAQAQPVNHQEVLGPYVGLGFGAAFGNRETADANSSNSEGLGHAGKVFAGWQLSEHFGVQAGYARFDDLNENTGSGATLVKQTATGRSLFLVGTGRLPLGESFALTGKAGLSFGKVGAASPGSAATSALLGSQTSLMVGSGVDYMLNRNLTFSVELESYGKISHQVKAQALTLVTRFSF